MKSDNKETDVMNAAMRKELAEKLLLYAVTDRHWLGERRRSDFPSAS